MTSNFATILHLVGLLGSVTAGYDNIGIPSSSKSTAQLELCEKVHRQPSSTRYGCGQCLTGYKENIKGLCVKELVCPSPETCKTYRRHPCKQDTHGKCGACLWKYLEIDGLCVTEPEVKNVIKRIEYILHVGTTPSDDIATNKLTEITTDKRETATVNNSKAEEAPPAPPPVNDLTANKRVPEGSVSSIKDAEGSASVSYSRAHSQGFNKLLFFGIVIGAALLCIVCLVVAGVCWYRLHRMKKLMKPAEYVGGGYTTANGHGGYSGDKDAMSRSDSSSGDRKLAHSAQMYHYQHHKQQMLALEKSLSDKLDESDPEDPEENEDGSYTVYECAGLAPAGEMEVSNPLFQAKNTSPTLSPTSPASSSLPSPPQAGVSDDVPQPESHDQSGTKATQPSESASPQD